MREYKYRIIDLFLFEYTISQRNIEVLRAEKLILKKQITNIENSTRQEIEILHQDPKVKDYGF